MPYWAELENAGSVQVGEPEVAGADEDGLGDGAGLLPEVGDWLADGAAEDEADGDADFEADREAEADAVAVRNPRTAPILGTTAIRGVAAARGIPAALTASASAPAETWTEAPSLAAAVAPLS